MTEGRLALRPIGRVESRLRDPADVPRQGDEGAPDAWLIVRDEYAAGLHGLEAGAELFLLTWLHLARRDVLEVHPRDDPERPLAGVFTTRSADRPNPIGLHRVRLLAVRGGRLHVAGLEAVDGTPILDLKPVLGSVETR